MRRQLLLILSCCILATAQSGKREDGPRGGPYRLSIFADSGRYSAAEPITITSELQNASDHDVRTRQVQGVTLYDIRVLLPGPDWLPFRYLAPLTEAGQRIKYPFHSVQVIGRTLKPGDAITERITISDLYSMTTPGEYRITFACRCPLGREYQALVSNEVRIAVAGGSNRVLKNLSTERTLRRKVWSWSAKSVGYVL